MRTRWLIALLLLIPLVDALLLVVVADVLTWQVTVALVVLTALVGSLLVRAEGRHTIRKIQRRLATGELPTDELVDGAMLLVAGAFLLTPGLVTDVIGFLLAVPLTRYPLREAFVRLAVKPYLDRKTGGMVSGNVWVGGFPNDGDSEDPFGGVAGDGFGGDGPSGDGAGGDPTDSDTIDVGADEYSFEDGDGTDTHRGT